jgi:oxygen-independent coproporphyrinogen-3 oxidase
MQQHPWGIYVHIPYCPAICPYCDFNVQRRRQPPWGRLAAALEAELEAQLRGPFANLPPPISLYFGGGTPSLAPAAMIANLIDRVRQRTGLEQGAEITLEANPGTVSTDYLAALWQAGCNRLSLGWQSTHDRLLKILGRTHSAADGAQAFAEARAAGFTNVNLDLIFAVPSQTQEECTADVAALINLRPEHVALYALTYHSGTPMARRLQQGRIKAAPEDLELQMMRDINSALCGAGYVHEEVSNYGLPATPARHNRLYWQGGAYLGLGPGAHSFTQQAWQQGHRWENRRDPDAYMAHWLDPATPTTAADPTEWKEQLSAHQLFTERILCGLRQPQGVDLSEPPFSAHRESMQPGLLAAQNHGWITQQNNRLRPTPEGLEQADGLAALFF